MSAAPPSSLPTTRAKQLVLLGAGDTHLALLLRLSQHPVPGLDVVLVTPQDPVFHNPSLPAFVAGQRTAQQCQIALSALLRRANGRWLAHRATGVDRTGQTVLLDNGDALGYDLLSLNVGLVQPRAVIELVLPGAREHGLFLQGAQAFATLWPRVVELSVQHLRSVAVIGGDALGLQIAMAIRHRLPQMAITLISHGATLSADFPLAMQAALLTALQRQSITLLPQRAVALTAGQVHLEGAARLACDVPVIALPGELPSWLAEAGLALTAQGRILVDSGGRAPGDARVFVHGALGCHRTARRATSPWQAEAAARQLCADLVSAAAGQPAKRSRRTGAPVSILSGGPGEAFACWHDMVWQGRLPRWVKDWAERRFMQSLGQAGLDNMLT